MSNRSKEAKEQVDYLSYLLRLWQEGEGQATTWRASLESPHTGERKGFANLDDLFTFLCEQTGGTPEPEAKAKAK